jgi:murein DD-endopeptidase MepM/ murein hydrolase activator NlpD
VTRGKALWTEKNHIRLVAEDGTNLYYMYLHMSPAALQDAGMKRGVWVSVNQGDKVGKVGNWLGTEANATTAHLHFEIRTPAPPYCAGFGCTNSPYWTLIRAYEQLIGMRGTEISE